MSYSQNRPWLDSTAAFEKVVLSFDRDAEEWLWPYAHRNYKKPSTSFEYWWENNNIIAFICSSKALQMETVQPESAAEEKL